MHQVQFQWLAIVSAGGETTGRTSDTSPQMLLFDGNDVSRGCTVSNLHRIEKRNSVNNSVDFKQAVRHLGRALRGPETANAFYLDVAPSRY